MAEGCLAFQPTNLMETSQFTLHISCQNSFSASPLHARPVAPLALTHTSYSWILFREKKKSLLAFLKPQTSDDGIVCLKRTAKFAVQIIIFTGWTLLTLRVFLSKKSFVIANKQLNLSPILSIKTREGEKFTFTVLLITPKGTCIVNVNCQFSDWVRWSLALLSACYRKGPASTLY